MAKKALKALKALKSLKGAGIGETIYDSAATFGRIMAFVRMVTGSIIGIVMIAVGIYLVRNKAAQSVNTTAEVATAECKTVEVGTPKKPRSTVRCDLTVTYTVNGKQLTTPLTDEGTSYSKGSIVNIQYNPDNPSDIRLKQAANKTVGIILIVIGLVIMLGSIIWFIITLKYKIAAAGEAAMTVGSWMTPNSPNSSYDNSSNVW